jgi:hypothetical protein
MASIIAKTEPNAPPAERRIDLRFLLYVYLHVAGVIATTLLLTWGLFVFAFLVLGGLSIDGMMHQLANLSTRYVAAGADRTGSFRMLIFSTHLLLSTGILFFRRHTLLPKWEARRG